MRPSISLTAAPYPCFPSAFLFFLQSAVQLHLEHRRYHLLAWEPTDWDRGWMSLKLIRFPTFPFAPEKVPLLAACLLCWTDSMV